MTKLVKEISVPDIGDFKEIEVIEVLVKPGDSVRAEDSLITLESDKAAMEVPSPLEGIVQSVMLNPGDRVSQGSLILTLEIAESAPIEVATPPPEDQKLKIEPEAPPLAASKPETPNESPVEIRVPDIGDFKEIEVIEVLVKAGDVLSKEDSLVTLESDKAAMEVPSPKAGVVEKVMLKPGDRVSQGSLILTLTQALSSHETQVPKPPETVVEPSVPLAIPEAKRLEAPLPLAAPDATPPHASPAIRKMARELGVDLSRVEGTGPKRRISKEDIQRFVKSVLSSQTDAAPASLGQAFGFSPRADIDFSRFGPVERLELTRIQKLSGPNLHRNWVSIPHVTQYEDADITDLEAFRTSLKSEAEARGIKLSLLPFVMKAVASTLKAYPTFNASLNGAGDTLILKSYCHIGVAVDTPDGLVVPVVRDVDRKSLFEVALELSELSQKARGKKLRGPDLEGGCFTISSLGGIGGTGFTPIINAPEVAILGLSRNQMKPVYQNGQFVPRLMLPLSLSYDHRVIDGAQGARFAVHLSQTLGDIRRVLL